jgi:hypothetical protein
VAAPSVTGPADPAAASGITGLDARVPSASTPQERAIASSAAQAGMATVVATGTDGAAHRVPLR